MDPVSVHNNGALRIERHQGYRLGVNVLSVKFCLQGLRNGRAKRLYACAEGQMYNQAIG